MLGMYSSPETSIQLNVAELTGLLRQHGLRFNEKTIERISKKIFSAVQKTNETFSIKKRDFFSAVAEGNLLKKYTKRISNLEDQKGTISVSESGCNILLDTID